MISSRVGCVWNGWLRPGSMLALTINNSRLGTMSLRQSHSSSVQRDTKSTFSAAVTKRCFSTLMWQSAQRLFFEEADLFENAFAAGAGIALKRLVISTSDCSTPIRSRLERSEERRVGKECRSRRRPEQ